METCPFLQPLQSGFHSCLKTSWSLWLMSCMAGVGKEHSSAFLFSLTYELLLPTKSMSPAQDWKSGAVSTSSLSPFLGERQHLFLFFFFCLCPFPLSSIQKALLKTGSSSTNCHLIVWIMGGVCDFPELRDSISKMWLPNGIPRWVFHISSLSHPFLWFRVCNGFSWRMVCKTWKALQLLPHRHEEASRHHMWPLRLQWDCHQCPKWIKHKFLGLPWIYSLLPWKVRRVKLLEIPLFLQSDI